MSENKATASKHYSEDGEGEDHEQGHFVGEWFSPGEASAVLVRTPSGDETTLPLNLLYDFYNVGGAAEDGGPLEVVQQATRTLEATSINGPPALTTVVSQSRGAVTTAAAALARKGVKRNVGGGSAGVGSSGGSPVLAKRSGDSGEHARCGVQKEVPQSPTSTVFSALENFQYTLDAPTSVVQRRGEDSLTYLNKGQFYTISLRCSAPEKFSKDARVKSMVQLVFREEKESSSELGLWQYWYSQQANPNQRAFDIDRKSCLHVDLDLIDDMAYNAVGFVWNPRLIAKISLRINCLSTEFSAQKGVKGIPLHLQIDTYDDLVNPSVEPVHRAYCQIKVFRDKGAERKNKEEFKTAEKRMQRLTRTGDGSTVMSPAAVFNPPSKTTTLYSASTVGPKPVLFRPSMPSPNQYFLDDMTSQSRDLASIMDREHRRTLPAAALATNDQLGCLEFGAPSNKSPRLIGGQLGAKRRPVVTVYVRKEEEKVYNALMLDTLTVADFKTAVSKKYNVPADTIKYVYKTTKRGLLVNFDDQMVEQFGDEDDFIIKFEFDNHSGHVHLYVIPTAYTQ
eukprot:m.155984 g.155984  ORF g.155984 m.155984 type:complete len:565 (+) comp38684_c0_seq2:73-1767(+)